MRGTSAAEAALLEPPAWAVRILKSEQPKHEVRISKGFWIDKYEVTNTSYQKFVDNADYVTKDL